MSDRKYLFSTLMLACSLALLTSVSVAPVGTSGYSTVSSRFDGLRRDFVLSPGLPATRLGAAMVPDAVPQVNALPSEIEEQDRLDDRDEPRASFLTPDSFRKISDRRSIAPRSIPSLYPLRC